MNKLPGGIWPVMLTPFTEKGTIDLKALEALTEFYVESGASGLFANCLSSEMLQLSPKERGTLTEKVVRFAADRLPVVSTGTFSKDHSENVEFISALYDMGVASVVINSSQLCDESAGEDLFFQQLEPLVEATGEIPLGMYECPVPYKRLISEELVAWLASTGRFSFFKDTSCDNDRIRARLFVSENSPLALYNANTPTALGSLRDGAAGLCPIGANFYPELYRYLYSNALKEESIEFVKVSQFLSKNDPVVHVLYPFSAKWFLQQRGLPLSTNTRIPIPRPQSGEMTRLKELLEMMEELFEIIKG